MTTIEGARERSGKTIGYPGWGILYHLLLGHLKPDSDNLIVETGTNWGCSTIAMAQAVRDAKRAGGWSRSRSTGRRIRRRCNTWRPRGLSDLVTLRKTDSVAGLKRLAMELKDSDGSVRFAFLDGGHGKDLVLAEFEAVEPLLERDALVVFDNTFPIAEVEKGDEPLVHEALQEVRSRWGGNLVNLPSCSWYTPGMAVWQREGW